eukprot:g461.t1
MGPAVRIAVFEMGRGPGGRTATRGSRKSAAISIDHGAPYFHAHSARFREWLQDSLISEGVVERVPAPRTAALSNTVADQKQAEQDKGQEEVFYRGCPSMSSICECLLREPGPNVDLHFRTQISAFERVDGSWVLRGRDGGDLGRFDHLVITSHTTGHERWRQVFKQEPPLQAAAAAIGTPEMAAMAKAVAQIDSSPVMVLMASFDDPALLAAHHTAGGPLPDVITLAADHPCLDKIVLTRRGDLLNVVAHSHGAFATAHLDVTGSNSAVSKMLAKEGKVDAETVDHERLVLTEMLAAVKTAVEALAPAGVSFCPDGPDGGPGVQYGPVVHRWGSARSHVTGAHGPPPASVPQAGLYLAGDFLTSPGGSVEDAVLSGLDAAQAIQAAIAERTAPASAGAAAGSGNL